MNSQINYRKDKGVSHKDLIPKELNEIHKKVVVSTADYYSEWAIEKCSIEEPKPKKNGNSTEPASGKVSQTTNIDQYY